MNFWRNSIQDIVLILVIFVGLGIFTKWVLAPIITDVVKDAIAKETTAITQTVSQEIDNKFKVYKGGQVDANVSPVADPTQNTTVTQPVTDTTNCIELSQFTSAQQRKIKRWLGD